ncbi:MAG: alpha-N-arabinofuranosidase, partial [Chitinophagales bacterium]
LLLLFLLPASKANTQNLQAKIKVDIDRKIGEIDSLLYGNFTEHLGRCIYGGIYDPSSAQANADGFRKDVIAATRDLGVSVIRWPGGNFSSGYHWMDGIGDPGQRPVRKDLAWGDSEPNKVGTDEFIKFIRSVHAEPYICVNLGTGTWDEARNWVEYCNAKTGFYFSDLRAKNGHPEPYHIKFWGLGNEIDGPWQMGHRNAEDYSKFALEAAKLMKWSDPGIRLIASGSSNYGAGADWINWNKTILTNLRDQIDYISVHHYSGNYDKDHNKFMAITRQVEDIINITEGLINQVRIQYKLKKPIYIAFDEYNVWYRAFNENKLEEHYNMEDVLVVAMYLNSFLRHANIVKMANMAQLVNVIAPIMVTQDKLWLQTIYFPLQLYSTNCHGQSLQTLVDGSHYDAGDAKDVPWLDATSVLNSSNQELIINVVNRNAEKAVETTIVNESGTLDKTATVITINSSSLSDENSSSDQKVKPSTKTIDLPGNQFSYPFPPHSFTMFKIKIKP